MMTTHGSGYTARTAMALTLLLIGASGFAASCNSEATPEYLTLWITSDPPKSGQLDTLRFLFTDGETTWPADPNSAETNKELSSSTNLVEAPIVIQIDYQALETFSSDEVTLQVSGLSQGLTRTSFEGPVTLSAKEVVEVHLRQLEDNCDADEDGFLDCTIAGCCASEDMPLSDCEPNNPDANPFAVEDPCEPCSDTIDNDCQGGDVPCVDSDEDGTPDCEESAADSSCPADAANNADIYPSRPELCDGLDNDCNGLTDETFILTTAKGTPGVGEPCGGGECANGTVVCVDANTVACSEQGALKDDCGADGNGNGKDEDCDGLTDEGCEASDLDGDGYSDDDCHTEDSGIYPGAQESCCLVTDGTAQACSLDGSDGATCADSERCLDTGDGTKCLPRQCDRNCDGAATLCSPEDKDGDGHKPPNDCDDTNPLVYPKAPEQCGDGIDQDCQFGDLSCEDLADGDGDNWSPQNGDCDDENNDVNPGEIEICDGLDNDCDDIIDEGNPDTFDTAGCAPWLGLKSRNTALVKGTCSAGVLVCVNGNGLSGEVICDGYVGPTADICNGLNDDCDDNCDFENDDCEEKIDEGFAAGGDPDAAIYDLSDPDHTSPLFLGDDCGEGACEGSTVICGEGAATLTCPSHADATPDVCDTIDNDCDGQTDESFTAGGSVTYTDLDGTTGKVLGESCGVGACANGTVTCSTDGSQLECDTAQKASPDLCNGIDDDCDGLTDEAFIAGGTVTISDTDGTGPLVKGDACGVGTCANGTVVCSPDGSQLECNSAQSASQDVCNGVDDDCDGVTDEPFKSGGTVTYTSTDGVGGLVLGNACGTGACGTGVVVCDPGGNSLICDNDAPTEDLCDGTDNDCDGDTDEAFVAGGTITYTATNGVANLVLGQACGTGSCGVGTVICAAGGNSLTCDNTPPSPDVCDELDNDCDGQTDESFGSGGAVTYSDLDGTDGLVKGDSCGVGACAGGGVVACTKSGETLTCTLATQASPDICDNIDNDCDGATDEEFADGGSVTYTDLDGTAGKVLGAACGTGSCGAGTVICHANGDTLTCDNDLPTPDICDGADNDCDGATDEEFADGGSVTYTDLDGAAGKVLGAACGTGSCGAGTVVCHDNGDVLTCDNAAPTPDVCDTLDNDCDGDTDEAFANGAVTYTDLDGTAGKALGDACGTGACGTGVVVCHANKDALSCDNAAPSTDVCDGVDNDCDGDIDEDFIAGGSVTYNDTDGGAPLVKGETCGSGACGEGVVSCTEDGIALRCSNSPGAIERCDDLDNDCDGQTDEDFKSGGSITVADLDGSGALSLGDSCGDIGECTIGEIACSPDGSTMACTTVPSVDICNDLDDDCDGNVDEDFLDIEVTNVDGTGTLKKGQTCPAVGTCTAGTVACNAAGNGLACTNTAQVSEDLCDEADNDCDGQTDEAFIAEGTVTYTDLDGTAGKVFGDGCGVGACTGGTVQCHAGGATLTCSSASTSSPDVCDEADNDCDGQTDEAFIAGGTVTYTDLDGTAGKVFGDGCGVGACTGGTVQCASGGDALTCSSGGSASPDICDKADNDCDGQTDEAFIAGGTVTYTDLDGTAGKVLADGCGVGACVDGKVTCHANGDALTCSSVGSATPDICDEADNDCDGQTDEAFIAGGSVTYTDLDGTAGKVFGDGCGVGDCAGGTVRCTSGGDTLECTTSSSASADICDDADNDCDGTVDENTAVSGELQALAGAGCDVAGICAAGTTAACTGGAYVCTYGAAGYEAGDEVSCDSADNDCDGTIDESLVLTDNGDLTTEGCLIAGACETESSATCVDGTYVCAHDAASYEAPEVSCDGVDNDCDGDTDEDLTLDDSNLGELADAGCTIQGQCGGDPVTASCTDAAYVCDYGAVTSYEGAEVTCDGLDNDCDGVVDDVNVVTDHDCDVSGLCADVTAACSGAGGWSCTYNDPNHESVEVTCDGIDNDCDDDVDDVNAATDHDCNVNGECADVTATCEGAAGWSCTYNDTDHEDGGETGAHICDGLDNDCDGVTDEGCLSQGDACGANSALCPDGNCIDGFCCDTACDTTCGACNVAGVEGTCSAHAAGSDPDAECDARPWINEVNYTVVNATLRGVEIAGKAGLDVTGWTVAGVSSDSSLLSKTSSFTTTLADSGNGFGYFFVEATDDTFESAHGAALFDAADNLVDYIAWDDITPAPGSLVEGATPTAVGVEDNDTAGTSLQLGGTGSFKADFTWQAAADNSLDAVNTTQSMNAPGDNVCDGAFACVNSCADGVTSGDETDIDCGGGLCGTPCTTGQSCDDNDDCDATCTASVCD